MATLINGKIFNAWFEKEVKDAELVCNESTEVIRIFNLAFNYLKELYQQPDIADTVYFYCIKRK